MGEIYDIRWDLYNRSHLYDIRILNRLLAAYACRSAHHLMLVSQLGALQRSVVVDRVHVLAALGNRVVWLL